MRLLHCLGSWTQEDVSLGLTSEAVEGTADTVGVEERQGIALTRLRCI